MLSNFNRLLGLPKKTFLLLGPRGTGKSTWLRSSISSKLVVDLLKSEDFFRYQAEPSMLRQQVEALRLAEGDWVVIDEAQRVPEILNEVHSLYESHGLNFALTGSSARKLKRADANLLAGRAIRRDFFPLVFGEIRYAADIHACIDFGTLPYVVTHPEFAADTLASYVATYLKEEIAAEAMVRNLEPFARFLMTCAQHHGQLLNIEAIAREASIKRRNADNYFQILEDTLLGIRLPAIRLGIKQKEASHPKFYFFDGGVARAAAGWIRETLPDAWRGFSFEGLVLGELRAYNSYLKRDKNIFHYAVTNSFDVDFVIETTKKILQRPATYIAIEVKLAKKWRSEWTSTLKQLVEAPNSPVSRGFGIYLGAESFQDGPITVLSFHDFVSKLWAGEVF